MDLPRIIFVDGLPGSGKSTTAQRLSLHLRRQGYRARWVFEHEEPHPVFSDERVRALREQSPEADYTLFETASAGYRELARIAREPNADIMLIDGSLFKPPPARSSYSGNHLLKSTIFLTKRSPLWLRIQSV